LFGISILVVILLQFDYARLTELIFQVDWLWILLGLACLVISNLFSAFRWSKIARFLGIPLSLQDAIRLYAQGITANTVLPGGIVGGDIWRTVALIQRGESKLTAGLSVFLCRLSGVWALAICSLGSLICAYVLDTLPESLSFCYVLSYGAALLSLCFLPCIAPLIKSLNLHILFRTLSVSVAVQVFALASFLACFKAFGVTPSFFAFIAVCAGVFLTAIIPASIGGFGAREAGAVVFLAQLGIPIEASFAGSILYGMLSTLQGLVFAYWWVRPEPLTETKIQSLKRRA
jgi:uncharacterized membrane protein YbhN (UPF0104 family)